MILWLLIVCRLSQPIWLFLPFFPANSDVCLLLQHPSSDCYNLALFFFVSQILPKVASIFSFKCCYCDVTVFQWPATVSWIKLFLSHWSLSCSARRGIVYSCDLSVSLKRTKKKWPKNISHLLYHMTQSMSPIGIERQRLLRLWVICGCYCLSPKLFIHVI